jgi:thiamine kinase-like enzyme
MFSVYCGNYLLCKTGHNLVQKFSQERSKEADDESEVRKWLRQQSQYLYAVGFDALARQWDKCNSNSGGYVEN